MTATTEFQQGCQERYKSEHKFGEAKQNHGLGRCRHVSQSRFLLQAVLTAIALNLNRLVKVLCGVSFSNGAIAANWGGSRQAQKIGAKQKKNDLK